MMHDNKKVVKKQLGLFLLLCLPVSWLLMGASYKIASEYEKNTIADLLMVISMFIPAIAGILTCVISKERVNSLQLFPRFRDNKRIYVIAVAIGVLLSCLSEPLVMLIFPNVQKMSGDVMPNMIFMILLFTMMGVMQSFLLLGEEIGWMGCLYPKLEKLYGTTIALICTGLIRGLWHVVMFTQWEDAVTGVREFLLLCVSNVLLGSVLVLLTKASKSVVPAAVVHALTNSVPSALAGFWVVDEVMYEKNELGIQLIGMLPAFVVGIVCYVILMKEAKSQGREQKFRR